MEGGLREHLGTIPTGLSRYSAEAGFTDFHDEVQLTSVSSSQRISKLTNHLD